MSKVGKQLREMLPKTMTMPGSGIVLVKDAFDPYTSYAVFPTGEKSWNEKVSNVSGISL